MVKKMLKRLVFLFCEEKSHIILQEKKGEFSFFGSIIIPFRAAEDLYIPCKVDERLKNAS